MIRDRRKSIAGGVNFWPHRSLLRNEKWIVQLLLNKYFVLVFTAYFLLLFCFLLFFFVQSKTLIPPNPWICSATIRLSNSEPKRIHPHKMDISLLKTWFFFNFDQRPKSTKAIRIKVLHEQWKRYFFPSNKWNTYNKFSLTALPLDFVESPRTRKRETGFQV